MLSAPGIRFPATHLKFHRHTRMVKSTTVRASRYGIGKVSDTHHIELFHCYNLVYSTAHCYLFLRGIVICLIFGLVGR